MFTFYYRWKHRRANQIAAFSLPKERERQIGQARINFSSYLAQSSVRGAPLKHRFTISFLVLLKRAFFIALFALIGWMVYQSTLALIIFRD